MTFAGFFLNDTGAVGAFADSNNGVPFTITQGQTLAAFEVSGDPVPEGNTFLLAGLALAGCIIGLQKRRQDAAGTALRISSHSIDL
jgi:hypothetical protein